MKKYDQTFYTSSKWLFKFGIIDLTSFQQQTSHTNKGELGSKKIITPKSNTQPITFCFSFHTSNKNQSLLSTCTHFPLTVKSLKSDLAFPTINLARCVQYINVKTKKIAHIYIRIIPCKFQYTHTHVLSQQPLPSSVLCRTVTVFTERDVKQYICMLWLILASRLTIFQNNTICHNYHFKINWQTVTQKLE